MKTENLIKTPVKYGKCSTVLSVEHANFKAFRRIKERLQIIV